MRTAESPRVLRIGSLGRVRGPNVNQPQSESELKATRRSVERGQPYGGDASVRATVARLGFESPSAPGKKVPKQKWTGPVHMPSLAVR